MTAPRRVSSCHVPLPADTTKEFPPSRAMAAWKEASVRSDGLKNNNPRIFPVSACGSGRACSRSASCNSSTTCSRDRSARSRKFCIGLKIFQRRAQLVDVFLFENESGKQAQNGRIARRAGQDVLGQ